MQVIDSEYNRGYRTHETDKVYWYIYGGLNAIKCEYYNDTYI